MKRLVPCLLLVACGGAEEPGVAPNGTNGTNGTIVVDREEIRFGNVVAGDSVLEQVRVQNPGTDTVPIFWRLEPEDTPVDVWMPRVVEGFETINVDVRFAPERGGAVRGDLVLTDGIVEHRVALRGTARSCPLAFVPETVELPKVFVGETARADLHLKNYAQRPVEYGPTNPRFGVCDGPPWYHGMCIALPGLRTSFITNGHIIDGQTQATGAVLHRPSKPEREVKDVRIASSPECVQDFRLVSEAQWGDVRCNFEALQEVVVDAGCETVTLECNNRRERTLHISGWSLSSLSSGEVEASRPLEVPALGTFSLDMEVCGRALLTVEGDFEDPAGKIEVAVGRSIRD